MDTNESDSSGERADLRCPDCWEIGLAPHDAFEGQYDDPDEKIINASRCPNEDCDTGRVPPADIERQRGGTESSTSSSGSMFGGLFSKKSVAVVGVVLLLGVLAIPTFAGGSFLGGGAAESDSGFALANEQGQIVVTNGVQYVDEDGGFSTTPVYYSSQENATQALNRLGSDSNTQSSGDGGSSSDNSDGGVTTSEPSDSDSDSGTNTGSQSESQSGSDGGSDTSTSTTVTQSPSAESVEGQSEGSSASSTADFDLSSFTTGESSVSSESDSDALLTTTELTGTVMDTDNNPIPNATVEITDIDRSTQTGGEGTYEFANVPEGPHTLTATTEVGVTPVRFVVTESGGIVIDGNPKNALYATKSGSEEIINNEISLVESPQYDISATGTGSDLQAPLTYAPSNVGQNVSVGLQPVTTANDAQYDFSTNDTNPQNELSTSFTTDDTTSQTLSVASTPSSKEVVIDEEGAGSTVIHVPGNLPPKDVTLRVSGAAQSAGSTSRVVESGESDTSVTIPSSSYEKRTVTVNLSEAEGSTNTLTGSGTVGTVAGSSSVDGLPSGNSTAVNITVRGNTQYNRDQVFNLGSGDDTYTALYGGNAPAENTKFVVEGAGKVVENDTAYTESGVMNKTFIAVNESKGVGNLTLTVTGNGSILPATQSSFSYNSNTLNTTLSGVSQPTGLSGSGNPKLTIQGNGTVSRTSGNGDIPTGIAKSLTLPDGEVSQQPVFNIRGTTESSTDELATLTRSGDVNDATPEYDGNLQSTKDYVTVDPNRQDQIVVRAGQTETIPKDVIDPAGSGFFTLRFDGYWETSNNKTDVIDPKPSDVGRINSKLPVESSNDLYAASHGSLSSKSEWVIERDENALDDFNSYVDAETDYGVFTPHTANGTPDNVSDADGFTFNNITDTQFGSVVVKMQSPRIDAKGVIQYQVNGGDWQDVSDGAVTLSEISAYPTNYTRYDITLPNTVDLTTDDVSLRVNPEYRELAMYSYEIGTDISTQRLPLQPGEEVRTHLPTGEAIRSTPYDWGFNHETSYTYSSKVEYREIFAPSGEVIVNDNRGNKGVDGYIDSGKYILNQTDNSIDTQFGIASSDTISNSGVKIENIGQVPFTMRVDESDLDKQEVDYSSVPNNLTVTSDGETIIEQSGNMTAAMHPINASAEPTVVADASDTVGFSAELVYSENIGTEDVTVSTDAGSEVIVDDALNKGEEVYTNLSSLSIEPFNTEFEITADGSRGYYDYAYRESTAPRDITVTANGETIATQTQPLEVGQTLTARPNLTRGPTTINFDATGVAPQKMNLSYGYLTETETTVKVDADNDLTFRQDETVQLGKGETKTFDIKEDRLTSLPDQPSKFNVDASPPVANYTLDYGVPDSTATANLTVVDDSGQVIINHSDPLPAGDTVTNSSVTLDSDTQYTTSATGSDNYQSSIEFDEKTVSEPVTLDVGGDGSVEQTTPKLSEGENKSYTLTVPPSDTTIAVDGGGNALAEYEYGYSASSSSTTPSNVTLTLGNTTRTVEGPFDGDENIDLGSIDGSEQTIGVTPDKGAVDVNATLTGYSSVENPELKIDGETIVSPSTEIVESKPYLIPYEKLDAGDTNVTLTADSGTPRYEFVMDARAGAESGSVVINDDKYPLSTLRSGDVVGTSHNETPSLSVNAVDEGDNNLQVITRDVDSIQPTLNVRFRYDRGAVNTTNPEVTVTTPDGVTNTKDVSGSAVESEELVNTTTVAIPADWFDTGTNTVTISSDGGTEVTATLEAEQVEADVDSFD